MSKSHHVQEANDCAGNTKHELQKMADVYTREATCLEEAYKKHTEEYKIWVAHRRDLLRFRAECLCSGNLLEAKEADNSIFQKEKEFLGQRYKLDESITRNRIMMEALQEYLKMGGHEMA